MATINKGAIGAIGVVQHITGTFSLDFGVEPGDSIKGYNDVAHVGAPNGANIALNRKLDRLYILMKSKKYGALHKRIPSFYSGYLSQG
jgi:hypothetical protein